MGLVFLAALVLRIGLSPLQGLTSDLNFFRGLSDGIVSYGPARFYDLVWCDYPPAYLYLLWAIGLLNRLLAVHGASHALSVLLIKVPPILADLGVGVLLFRWAARVRPQGRPAAIAALFLFNPAILIDSAVWGQTDSVVAFWLVWAVSAFLAIEKGAVIGGAILLGLAILTKPHALLLAPLLTVWSFRHRLLKRQRFFLLLTPCVMILLARPFSGPHPVEWLIHLYARTAQEYPYTSVNAYNIWGFIEGSWKSDQRYALFLTYRQWGVVLFGLNYLLVIWQLWRRPSRSMMVTGGFLVLFGAFLFLTRMHERYLYLAVLLALAAFIQTGRRSWLVLYGLLSTTLIVNLLHVLYIYDYHSLLGERGVGKCLAWCFQGPGTVKVLSLVNLLIWCKGMVEFKRLAAAEGTKQPSLIVSSTGAQGVWSPPPPPPVLHAVATRRTSDRVIVALFMMGALALYLPRLGIPSTEYYDEVHHVKTARQFLYHEEITEWTHPHLGKLAMAASIALLGDRSFAWRLPEALVGSVIIVLVYALGTYAFENRTIGVLAAVLLLSDGMQFTLSRIGMLEVYVVCFVLLAYLIYARNFLHGWRGTSQAFFGVGVALGLACASKWIALYAYAGIMGLVGLSLARARAAGMPTFDKRLDAVAIRVVAYLILLPAVIYLLSYGWYIHLGHSLGDILNTQRNMWNYHAGIKDTHTYSSPWWSWPWLLRPVWTYFHSSQPGQIEGSVILGNPAIFWVAIPCLVYVAWRAITKADRGCDLIATAFCMQYLPWSLSPRKLLFAHHFYSALPFACLAIAYCLCQLWSRPRARWVVPVYLLLAIGLFWYFYPILSALPITERSFQSRMWFRGWM